MSSRSKPPGRRAALLFRLVVLDALQCASKPRWLLVPPAFAAATFLFKPSVTFDPLQQVYIAVSPWDLVLSFQTLQHFLLWVFALGFAALVGTVSPREAGQGLGQLLLLRASSRELWWLSRLGSIGLQALLFVALGFSSILLAGALLPRGTGSPGTHLGALASASRLYPQEAQVPVLLLLLLTGFYLAWGLWLYGSILATTSLLSQRPFVPLTVTVLWLMLSVDSLGPDLQGESRLLNLVYLLSYRKHLQLGGMPLGSFFMTTGVALAGVALLGAWRARRVEL